tara:strand:+ start:414 stop:1229 length:816 start_codon:yes stop_codon:yes gene_type:complete
MKIGIIGVGVVGSAIKHGFEKLGHEVKIHDTKYTTIYNKTTINDVLDTDVCFVCVPTNPMDDGSCDVSIVNEVVQDLADNSYIGTIAIKSTVEPGTTCMLQSKYSAQLTICFVPEFLRERCAISDFVDNHDLCVIGTTDEAVYKMIKRSHGKFPKKFIMVNPLEAELCKYFSNVHNATQIIFANSFYEICKKLGADYNVVKDSMVHRKTIFDHYLDCNENIRGFGGVCLPKDTAAINNLVKRHKLDIKFFETLLEENKKYRITVPGGMRLE